MRGFWTDLYDSAADAVQTMINPTSMIVKKGTEAGVRYRQGTTVPAKAEEPAIPVEKVTRMVWPPVGEPCPTGYTKIGGHCEKDVTQEYEPGLVVIAPAPRVEPGAPRYVKPQCPKGMYQDSDGNCLGTPKGDGKTWLWVLTGVLVVGAVAMAFRRRGS